MLKHYLKIAIRSILKDKGYSIINVIGLSIAIACCFLLIFWIRFELSYEKCYSNADRIYRIMIEEKRNDGVSYNTWIRPGICYQLKETFPQLSAATFFHSETLPFLEVGKEEKDGIMASLVSVNEDFLRMFAFEYTEGSPQHAVQHKGCIMTEETAHKFFGNQSAVGKKIKFGDLIECTIEAVVKTPSNTDIRFDILTFSEGWLTYGNHYIMMRKGQEVTPEFEQQLAGFLSTQQETDNKLRIQPIKKIHLHAPESVDPNAPGRLNQIYLFSLAALLILIVAVINYVNTSIARSLNRMKEVGVRKVTGAERRQLIERFLFESFILSLFSVLMALTLTKALFPGFSGIMGHEVAFSLNFVALLIALLVCCLVTLMSGGYAAFYLSALNPVYIFRGASQTGSKEMLRKALMGVQFFLSIAILICTLVIYKQINAIFNADTGVDRKNVIVLESGLWYDVENFIQVIKKENPNIIDATIAGNPPYNASWTYSGVSWEGSNDAVKEMEFAQITCDHNYANTFGLQIISGEFIPPGLTWWQDSEEKSFNIVINESFQKLMGEENPLGITVMYAWETKGKIIGVVKDFNFKPLRTDITPLIISFNPEASSSVYIKTTGKNKQATLDYILAKYKDMKPDDSKRPAIYHTAEDEYNQMYETELRTANMLSVFAVISFFLSLMGVVSMVSFMIEKRTKEIAIRKINGANMMDITILFIRDTIKIAFIASIVAVPVCYAIMYNWLQGYTYQTSLSWWIFATIPFFMLLVTGLVIAIQIYLTARQNPVESLRSE